MSTKITLSHDKDYHLYQECYDDKNVYIRVDGYEFEVNNKSATIQIPLEIWEKIVSEWPNSKNRFIPKDEEYERQWSENVDQFIKDME